MPGLTLKFRYYLLTDEDGNPIKDGEDEQFVPVLKKARHSGGDPKPKPRQKAYHSPEGWRDPRTKKLWHVEDNNYSTPKDKWETCPCNDVLER